VENLPVDRSPDWQSSLPDCLLASSGIDLHFVLDNVLYHALYRGQGIGPEFQRRMEDIRNMKQNDIAFLGLGVKFPALIDAPGVSPWDPNQLDIWAAESASNNNAVHAARFLLNLWMPSREWQCGRFDMNEAIQNWDRTHRRAFLDWATHETSVA